MDHPSRFAVLVGSPRKRHTDHLASLVCEGIESEGGTCEVFRLSEHMVGGCVDCESCITTGECIIDDDFARFEAVMDAADALIVCTPVYFAGPPSQLKALYDRMQPRWARRYVHGLPMPEKRPATLVVTGNGHDPFGYDPLVTITRSALNIADFRLGEVVDFIGFGEDDIYDIDEETRALTLGRDLVRRR